MFPIETIVWFYLSTEVLCSSCDLQEVLEVLISCPFVSYGRVDTLELGQSRATTFCSDVDLLFYK